MRLKGVQKCAILGATLCTVHFIAKTFLFRPFCFSAARVGRPTSSTPGFRTSVGSRAQVAKNVLLPTTGKLCTWRGMQLWRPDWTRSTSCTGNVYEQSPSYSEIRYVTLRIGRGSNVWTRQIRFYGMCSRAILRQNSSLNRGNAMSNFISSNSLHLCAQ